jgi:predicted nuclease with TOPRIM domain
MSDLELTMMRRVGELNKENARLKAEVNELADGLKLASEVGIKMADEVSRLKAEVEELKSQPDPLTAYLYADTLRRDDIKTLKAQVERLTKAGDAMQDDLKIQVWPWASQFESIQQWNAAKEGKQP